MHQASLEAALLQSEQRFRSLFEESRDAIYFTRVDGSFIDANTSFLELFELSRAELSGLSAGTLYADPAERLHFQAEIVATDCVRDFEVKLRTFAGRTIDCLLNATLHRSAEGDILWYQGIIHDVTERKRAVEQLAHNAFHDSLTGLPNRALFMDRLERLIRHSQRHASYNFAVLFLDLDRFKVINDSLGHVLGDTLLLAIGQRLEACIRQGDTVARLGGDEFAILLDDVKDSSDATRVADRVNRDLGVVFPLRGHEVFTSASIGIALSTTGYTRPDEVLRDADTAMYRAKGLGGGRYELFDRAMHAHAVQQLELETDLRHALDRSELVVHYQPIITLATGELNGFEALVRWQHPRRGLVMPAEFISIAEETGSIVPIGWVVLRAACSRMNDWLRKYPHADALTISVNLSSRQFTQPDLIDQIDAILAETGCPPGNLKLELTESVVMDNAEGAVGMLEQLRARGIHLCIDDFGTGYSSLSYLNQFPIDTLKIDRSFISKIGENGSSVDLIETMVVLSRVLGMDAVAEGIETPEQLELVRRLGAQMAQGFYLSLPLEHAAAEDLLRRARTW
ncbi:MAG: putative bifunctional diguanylate cyclase/phosphodiesterase [Gemmatimonadota bacterium]